jgi:hypothetical protein
MYVFYVNNSEKWQDENSISTTVCTRRNEPHEQS